jgi:hypothetical protein
MLDLALSLLQHFSYYRNCNNTIKCAKAVDTDEPVSIKWKEYRQALRDVTLQDDPFNIIWPDEPI